MPLLRAQASDNVERKYSDQKHRVDASCRSQQQRTCGGKLCLPIALFA